ncbi:MAG: hypothetical protein KDD58_06075 [Bdellovibrionales bacterium]|nr:hypothetical protein [Bdellovibrionales bacterium]
MKNSITYIFSLICVASFLVGCATNPHKARKIETEMEKTANVSGDTNLGVKDGNLVVQKKVQMNEELRRLQNEVYSLEDKVYGNRKFGSEGLYGSLKTCRKKVTSKEYGGDGKLMWTEPIDRVTDKEDEWEVGIDEKDKIVGVSEEFLLDRIKRFKGYKRTLQKREDEYKEKLEICDAKLEAVKFDANKKSSSAAQ